MTKHKGHDYKITNYPQLNIILQRTIHKNQFAEYLNVLQEVLCVGLKNIMRKVQ